MAYIPITDDQAEAFDTLEQIADKKILSEDEYKKARAAGEKIEKEIVRPIVASDKLRAEMEQEVASNISKRKQQHQIDTSAPDFDIKGFTESIRTAATNIEISLQSFVTATKEANKSLSQGAIQAAFDAVKATRAALTENMPALAQSLKLVGERWKAIEAAHKEGFWDYYIELEMYILIELDIAAESNPEFAKYTTFDVAEYGFTPEGEPAEGIFKDIIERAIRRRREYEQGEATIEMLSVTMERTEKAIAKAEAQAKKTKITAKPTERVDFPLDKPNREIWDLLSGSKFNDQLQLATVTIDTSKGNKKREAGIIYGISFDKLEEVAPNLKITKQLTQYDKRVYIAASAIYNAGNEVTTATQIYNAMGNKGKPKAAAVKKINDSLTKMGAARVYLNNTHEAKKYSRYPVFKYDADLLPFERITATINGQETEAAIHFFREPPLMTFAKERKQISTFSVQVLESPVNKTETNLAIDDYLLERISHIKKGNANPKILYDTLYEKCKITTKMQKVRAPEKIRRYLDHYKSCKFIYDYAEESDGIYIFVSKAAKGKKS